MGGLTCQSTCGTCGCNKEERDELEVVYSQQRESNVNLDSLAAGQKVVIKAGSQQKFETLRAGNYRDFVGTNKTTLVSRSLTMQLEKEFKKS